MLADYALLLAGTVLVNNFVLVQFLGLCSFMGVSNKLNASVGGHHLRTDPGFRLQLPDLYLAVGAPGTHPFEDHRLYSGDRGGAVHGDGSVKSSPLLHRVLGVYLPLITTNCAVLGVALLNINQAHNFTESLFYGFGAAVGFSLVLVLFAAMRERLAVADVPEPFQGAAIGMITAGLASLAFMGFAGLV